MKIKLIITIIVSTFFLNACIGISNVKSSKAFIESNPSMKLKEDWLFHVDEVAFNINPWNEINSDTLIFPIPFHTTYQGGFTEYFAATIIIKSKINDSYINISEIEYIDSLKKIHNPKYMRGPFNCKKHAVNNPKKIKRVSASKKAKLINGIKNCIFIEFNVKAPSPDKLFKFNLKKVTSKTKKVNIPIMSFSDKKNNNLVVLP